jgi:uncharacterized membrane-anchored protein YitT (DUF2179 family)
VQKYFWNPIITLVVTLSIISIGAKLLSLILAKFKNKNTIPLLLLYYGITLVSVVVVFSFWSSFGVVFGYFNHLNAYYGDSFYQAPATHYSMRLILFVIATSIIINLIPNKQILRLFRQK